METIATILFYVYAIVLLGGGLAALVLQVIDDFRQRNINRLDGWNLRWSDALLIAWCIVFASMVLAMVLAQIAQKIDNQYWGISISIIGWQGGLLLVLVLLIKLYPKQFNLRLSTVSLSLPAVIRQSVVQLLAAVLLLGGINQCWRYALNLLQEHGMGNFMREQELVSLLGERLPIGVIITMIVTAVVIAPIAEELLFRGLFYRFLRSRMKARNAMVISSVCFGAMHANAVSFLPLVFLGMVLTRAYEHSGNIKVPILMHAIFNANTVIIVLCQPYLNTLLDSIAS